MSDITPALRLNVAVLNAVSAASNAVSSSVDVSDCTLGALQVTWTGTSLNGTVTLEASLDGVNWGALQTVSVTGSGGSVIQDLPSIGMPYLRASYARVAGTGTLTVRISAKK